MRNISAKMLIAKITNFEVSPNIFKIYIVKKEKTLKVISFWNLCILLILLNSSRILRVIEQQTTKHSWNL